MAYDINWEHDGVYWKYSGEVSGKELIEASTAIYGDPRFDALRYKLVDFLDVDKIKIDEKEVTLIACQHKAAEKSNPYIKNAIVTTSDSELANLFATYFSDSPWEVKIFHVLDEANNWLGRKPSF